MDAIDRMQQAEEEMAARRLAAIPRPGSGEPPAARDCADCGAPIAAARLQALPAARTCIECQRELEEGA